MVYPKDSARVGPGYDCTPSSPPTYTTGQSGGHPSGHSLGGTHYFPVKVAQVPVSSTKHHPGRLCIKGNVHTSATCPQKSVGATRPTHNGCVGQARSLAQISPQSSQQAHSPLRARSFFPILYQNYQCIGIRNGRSMKRPRGKYFVWSSPTQSRLVSSSNPKEGVTINDL